MNSFILISLVLSPGVSLIYYLFRFYVPNDKLAYLFSFIRIPLFYKVHQGVYYRAFIFAVLLSVNYLLRFLNSGILPTFSDYNLLISHTLVTLLAVTISGIPDFMQALRKFAWISIFFGLIQQVLKNFGVDIEGFTLTHPAQVGRYKYDPWAPYLFRVAGMQLESSQYSFLLCLILILLRLHKSYSNITLEVALVLSILANGSTTGFLALFIAFFLTVPARALRLTIYLTVLLTSLLIFYYSNVSRSLELNLKAMATIIMSGDIKSAIYISPRADSLYNTFDLFKIDNFIFGIGLEYRSGHDFISVTLLGIGLVGVLIVIQHWYFFRSKYFLKIILFMLIFAISNGSLLDPVYQLVTVYFVVTRKRFRTNNLSERENGRYINSG